MTCVLPPSSPDRRWVATGSHWDDGRSKCARIWNADTGRLVHDLPLEGSTLPVQPDGRRLATMNLSGSQLWEVGSWRLLRRFDRGGVAFSPDSRLLALGGVFGAIRLVEAETGGRSPA